MARALGKGARGHCSPHVASGWRCRVAGGGEGVCKRGERRGPTDGQGRGSGTLVMATASLPSLPALPTRTGSKACLETALCLVNRDSMSS